jgi:hypothetical protein
MPTGGKYSNSHTPESKTNRVPTNFVLNQHRFVIRQGQVVTDRKQADLQGKKIFRGGFFCYFARSGARQQPPPSHANDKKCELPMTKFGSGRKA